MKEEGIFRPDPASDLQSHPVSAPVQLRQVLIGGELPVIIIWQEFKGRRSSIMNNKKLSSGTEYRVMTSACAFVF